MKQPEIRTRRKVQQNHANNPLIDIIRVFMYGAMLMYLMCEVTARQPDLSTYSTLKKACITLGRTLLFLASLSIPIYVAYLVIEEILLDLDLANLAITVLVTVAVEIEIIIYGYRLIAQWIAAFSTRAFGLM